jgi:hypothetical protein
MNHDRAGDATPANWFTKSFLPAVADGLEDTHAKNKLKLQRGQRSRVIFRNVLPTIALGTTLLHHANMINRAGDDAPTSC